MDTQVLPEGERGELDPKLCAHVKPDGSQCRGKRGATGYCAGHARSMGLLKPREAQAEAAAQAAASIEEHAAAAATAQELAQASLSARAAAFLAKPQTQRLLERRWLQILESGTDQELIRLVKELTDRVEGRAGEAKPEPKPELPADLAELDAMTTDELVALLRD